MAVNAVTKDSKIKLNLDGGVDQKGKQIVKSKTYSKVKTAATNEDVYSVAKTLANLQKMPVVSIRRIDEIELVENI
ncbi:DUF1659 domain-containing protein [Caloranaerobacter azorensis]|uniref:DUF1659 domain-containing protein n=3 Tax=Caloranaerobacter azorensis TaxID=116090 RepID=A0A1M5W0K6_9FIRM|nr:DUF1659 domain-containing protein [Caloranaerobacter azorensis]KGG79969.1 hypothetical protein Y919_08765 [Caloranaerobacter azorensis H53214]QIB27522.1 DUF1659 domain-containing protein [Caloranaerobacter azorensis]SHH80958.1 Protein of unknown function [Caloranaerobacter azorensis DSM 13643]